MTFTSPDARGIGAVRYPRLVPRNEDYAKLLAKPTLTNLDNERPAWLDLAHKKLAVAVFAACGWSADLANEEILARVLGLNLARGTPLSFQRHHVDQPRTRCSTRCSGITATL